LLFHLRQEEYSPCTAISVDDRHIPVADTLDWEYEFFPVDTDVTDIMVNATKSNRFGN
jgi:hypothetical protein